MDTAELKRRIKAEIDWLRESAESESADGNDFDATSHDTAADYLERVMGWVDELEEKK